MKHTRSIMADLKSKPSFEAADYDAVETGDASDESLLALESASIINEVGEQFSEAGQLDDKSERLDTLVDYVDSQINQPGYVATPNEVALIEQAVDATVDGTGEDVDTVMPSLESAEGSHVSLESLKENITSFLKASKELVVNTGRNLARFFKVTLTRLGSIKDRIETLEGKLKEKHTIEGTVEISAAASIPTAFKDNAFLSDHGKIINELENLSKQTQNLSNEYSTRVLGLYDDFVTQVQKLFDDGAGEDDSHAVVRDAVGKKIITQINALFDLNNKTFKTGKQFGGLFIDMANGAKSESIVTASKELEKAMPEVYMAGNINGRETEIKGINKDGIRRVITSIKGSLANLRNNKKTETMEMIDWYSGGWALDDAVRTAFYGESFTVFQGAINRINRAFMHSYVRPQMAYIDHFIRVANAQLALCDKAVNVTKKEEE